MRILSHILLLLILTVLTACVGTVEDQAKIDKSSIARAVKINFDGVSSCHAVSDKKIEVLFPPAVITAGGVDANTLVYKVYLNGNFDNSVGSMMAQDLRSDESGKYHLEIDELTLNTTYSFIVRAEDPRTGIEDNNSVSCSTRTKDEKLPLFDGIVDVESYPGVQGRTSLLLKWNTALAAEYLLGGIPVNGYKISKYNIYHSSTSDNPEDMELLSSINENSLSPVTQFQVSGLLQGQRYFYMIRALDESGREEENRIVKSASTATPQNVSFSGISTLTVPPNASGYTSLRATWAKPQGDFNRIRVFAISEDAPIFNSTSIDPNDPTYQTADLTDVTKLDSLVVGLSPNKRYAVFVVACMYDGTTCSTKAGDTKKLTATTTPALAPFGGLSTITPLAGALGLNNVTLSWAAPATTAGVCDGINLYEKGVALKDCGDPALGAEEACTNSSATCNSTAINVGNLKTGIEYCFSAKVYEGSREQTTGLVEKCVTTRFDAPVFQSPPTCVADSSGTKVKIDWVAPSPTGLFTHYLVMAKKDDGLTLNPTNWQANAKAIYEGTLDDPDLGTVSAYKYSLRAKSTLTYTVQGLSPDTNYRLMIKAYMVAEDTHYYDEGTTIINCKTRPLTLNFGGWKHILSIGPRINGLADHREVSSTEKLAANVSANPSLDDVSFAARGIEPEALITTTGILHPKVVKDGSIAPESIGTNGLVQLMWSEFLTPEGSSIESFLYSQGLATIDGDGYFIYRKVTPGATNENEYENTLNQIQGSNTGWELLNSSSPILVDPVTKIATFTDILPEGFHPVHSTNGTIAFRDKANSGKVIWYTVRFKLHGKLVGFQTNTNKDAIAPVIIPPANMASIHHWMANRKNCELLNKDFDRNDEYRCVYGGIGAREIDSQAYYDMGGHVLVDRWSLGCNFTRYDEEKSCKNSNSIVDQLNQSVVGAYYAIDGTNHNGGNYYSYYFLDAEMKDGDCTSSKHATDPSTLQNYPNAPKGAVMFNSADWGCYYRVQDMLTGVPNWNQTNAWKKISDSTYTNFSTGNAESSRLPPAINNEILNRIYPTNNDLDAAKGVGAVISSNDSSLPPIIGVTHSQGHYLCQSHAITIQSGSNKSVPIRKRHLASQEYTTMSLPHPNTSDANRVAVEEGMKSLTGWNEINVDGYNKSIQPRNSNSLGQCSLYDTAGEDGYWYKLGFKTNRLTKQIHHGTYSLPSIWVTGSYDVGGISSRSDGTERCISGFGVQDHMGNNDFWLAEQMLCSANADGTNGECFTKPTSIMVDDYHAANTSNRWPKTRYSETETTYYGSEMMKNSVNEYYKFSLYIDQAFTSSFGVPQDSKTQYPYTPSGYLYPGNTTDQSIHYPFKNYQFNMVSGLPLNCDSGLCHADDQINYGLLSFPSNFGTMSDKYFELKYTPTITANDYFVKYRRRNQAKPQSNYYSWASWTHPYYAQWFLLNDGNYEAVSATRRTHRYSMDWMLKNEETESNMGVRCAVKIKLGLAGNIEAVDDEIPE